jgi:serine/threonine-protein kinase RsbW
MREAIMAQSPEQPAAKPATRTEQAEVEQAEVEQAEVEQAEVEQAEVEHFSDALEMQIPARAEWVRVVRLATAGVASRAGFAYDDIEDIKLAVAEACNNAILHSGGAPDSDSIGDGSTPGAGSAIVTIRWQLLKNGLRISVSDEGRLDPPGLPRRAGSTPKARESERPVHELPESGMGLLLIESLMDNVEHETGAHADTTLHMTKRVPPEKVTNANSAPEKNVAPHHSTTKPDPDAPVALSPSRTAR